jgi:general stress protein YciG
VLTDQARYSLFRRKLLDRIEGIVRESVKPMEKIEGIRILQVDGLNGNGGGGNGGRSATDEVIDSALRYRVQAPLIDSILADIGVEGGSLSKMPGLIREARDMQGIRDSSRKGGGDSQPASPPAAGTGTGEAPTERGPRKKGS